MDPGRAEERPPKNTQWQKGQCGNPKRQYKRTVKGTIELIDEAFADQIDIVENGEARRVSVFEAILMQLWFKEISGDKRATAVRLKYQEFVARQNGGGGGEFIITNSEPDIEKKETPASPATARASSVLPIPGQADEENPFRSAGAEAAKEFWILEKGDGFLKFEFGFAHAHEQRRTQAPRSFAFESRLSSHITF